MFHAIWHIEIRGPEAEGILSNSNIQIPTQKSKFGANS